MNWRIGAVAVAAAGVFLLALQRKASRTVTDAGFWFEDFPFSIDGPTTALKGPVGVEGIGRGIGRAAAHELAHAILGPTSAMDTRTDENSYEHFSFSRPSQYYGDLHWTTARPLLERKVGWHQERGPR